jgi:hypothetical protein
VVVVKELVRPDLLVEVEAVAEASAPRPRAAKAVHKSGRAPARRKR